MKHGRNTSLFDRFRNLHVTELQDYCLIDKETVPALKKCFNLLSNGVKGAVLKASYDYQKQYSYRDLIVQESADSDKSSINHSYPARIAFYIWRFYFVHMEFVMKALGEINSREQHRETLLEVLRRDDLRVCCLGGGPLPEVVALIQFREIALHSPTPAPGIHVHNLDLNAESWGLAFQTLANELNRVCSLGHVPVNDIDFIPCDLLSRDEVQRHIEHIKRSQVIFASKAFSEIWCLGPNQAEENLTHILSSIQIGSIFIYMDNYRGASVSWFKTHDWKNSGFKRLYSFEGVLTVQQEIPPVRIGVYHIYPIQMMKAVVKVYIKVSNTPLRRRWRTINYGGARSSENETCECDNELDRKQRWWEWSPEDEEDDSIGEEYYDSAEVEEEIFMQLYELQNNKHNR
jgi:hypothetical protein